MSPDDHPKFDDADGLIRAGVGEAVIDEASGSVRAALANAMVGMKAKFYGRGPDKAKAYIVDGYAFVVMEGGLTPNEQVLLADGKDNLVRDYRLAFEGAMKTTVCEAVEEILGREVLTYQSQIVFDPVRAFEIFILGEKKG